MTTRTLLHLSAWAPVVLALLSGIASAIYVESELIAMFFLQLALGVASSYSLIYHLDQIDKHLPYAQPSSKD